jgi:hypothetical protein
MQRVRSVIVPAVAVLAVAAMAATAPAKSSTTKLYAKMSGSQETPDKGNPKATGKATITFSAKKGLCYSITPRHLSGKAAAGHIHKGKKGEAGPVFVALFTKPKKLQNGNLHGCVSSTAAQNAAIKAKPSDFYVNVHTKKYPAGELRGQLTKKAYF